MKIEDFIKSLRKKREFRKISQSKVGEILGTSKASISHLENYNGQKIREPRLSRLIKYAEAIGYTVEMKLKRND